MILGCEQEKASREELLCEGLNVGILTISNVEAVRFAKPRLRAFLAWRPKAIELSFHRAQGYHQPIINRRDSLSQQECVEVSESYLLGIKTVKTVPLV